MPRTRAVPVGRPDSAVARPGEVSRRWRLDPARFAAHGSGSVLLEGGGWRCVQRTLERGGDNEMKGEGKVNLSTSVSIEASPMLIS